MYDAEFANNWKVNESGPLMFCIHLAHFTFQSSATASACFDGLSAPEGGLFILQEGVLVWIPIGVKALVITTSTTTCRMIRYPPVKRPLCLLGQARMQVRPGRAKHQVQEQRILQPHHLKAHSDKTRLSSAKLAFGFVTG